MPEDWLRIQSLYGPAAEGNWHTLIYEEQAGPTDTLTPELRALPNLIKLGGTPAALWARFYHHGHPVLRCGSANIAIAQAIRERFGVLASGEWSLDTRAGVVWLGCDDGGVYYRDNPLPQGPLCEPHLWKQVVGANGISGCYAGGDADYCLLRVSTPVQNLHPDLARLCDYSRRALILLYYPEDSASDRAQFRYFAPQYGVDEDAATGSASVQVAQFLRQCYGQTHMRLEQHSAQGGDIQTEIHGDQVWVRGQARCYPA